MGSWVCLFRCAPHLKREMWGTHVLRSEMSQDQARRSLPYNRFVPALALRRTGLSRRTVTAFLLLLRLGCPTKNSRSLHCAHPQSGFASVGTTIHLQPMNFSKNYRLSEDLPDTWVSPVCYTVELSASTAILGTLPPGDHAVARRTNSRARSLRVGTTRDRRTWPRFADVFCFESNRRA